MVRPGSCADRPGPRPRADRSHGRGRADLRRGAPHEPRPGRRAAGRARRGRRRRHLVPPRLAPRRGRPQGRDTVAECLRVLLRLGNADRAVDLLLPRLAWLEELRTPSTRMDFAATAAHVLERAAAVGLAPDEVDGRPPPRSPPSCAGRRRDRRRLRRAVRDTVVSEPSRATTTTHRFRPSRPFPHWPAGDRPRGVDLAPRPPARGAERAWSSGPPSSGTGCSSSSRTSTSTSRPGCATARASPSPRPPEEWLARAFLDRVSAQDVGAPDAHRARLLEAAESARRAGDEVELARAEAEAAVLAGDEATALAIADRLDGDGLPGEAAGIWRRIAYFGTPDDPGALMARSAEGYLRAGQHRRHLLGEVETALAMGTTDAAGAAGPPRRRRAPGRRHPRPAGRRLRRRPGRGLGRAGGDLDGAEEQLRAALAVDDGPERARVPVLLLLCDVLVDRNDYEPLERPAADVVAVATADRDPVLLAHGQRFLGLAYVENGLARPRPSSSSRPRSPSCASTPPPSWAPSARLSGNSLVGLGQWTAARTAFATAATSFEAEERTLEAGHAQRRAGNAAWDAQDSEAAAIHFDAAVEKSPGRRRGPPPRRGPALARGPARRHRRPPGGHRRARRRDRRGHRPGRRDRGRRGAVGPRGRRAAHPAAGGPPPGRPRRRRRSGRAPGPRRGARRGRVRARPARRGCCHARRRRPARGG